MRSHTGFGLKMIPLALKSSLREASLIHDPVMKVKKQQLKWESGNLVDDDEDSLETSDEAIFSSFLSTYYDEIGEKLTEFKRLKQLLKVNVIQSII